MDTFDIFKKDEQWKVAKEGSERALRSFDRKNLAVSFGRDYVRTHGGHLRIWSADGATLQEERTYPGAGGAESGTAGEVRSEPDKGVFGGIARGASDATEAVGRLLPAVGEYINRGIYGTSYYAAYGVVLAAVAISRSIPLPGPLARGLHEGAEAAIDTYEIEHAEIVQGISAANG
jgi:hypothetical protein